MEARQAMPRSRFRPTDEQRQKVKALAGYGLPHKEIATVAGVGCIATLRKYFPEELTLGPLEAQSNVTRTLFRLATSGRNPAATMFWLKTRARWSEGARSRSSSHPGTWCGRSRSISRRAHRRIRSGSTKPCGALMRPATNRCAGKETKSTMRATQRRLRVVAAPGLAPLNRLWDGHLGCS